jgi:hypothetical protein
MLFLWKMRCDALLYVIVFSMRRIEIAMERSSLLLIAVLPFHFTHSARTQITNNSVFPGLSSPRSVWPGFPAEVDSTRLDSSGRIEKERRERDQAGQTSLSTILRFSFLFFRPGLRGWVLVSGLRMLACSEISSLFISWMRLYRRALEKTSVYRDETTCIFPHSSVVSKLQTPFSGCE